MSHNDAMPDYLTDLFFATILPIYDHHQQLLVDLEQRLASWYYSFLFSHSLLLNIKSKLCMLDILNSVHFAVVMVALWNRADHYMVSVVSSYFCFFSSPNLSHRRLDVCHTSTRGVALVCISDAGLKHAAWLPGNAGRKKVAKIRHLGSIAHICRLYLRN